MDELNVGSCVRVSSQMPKGALAEALANTRGVIVKATYWTENPHTGVPIEVCAVLFEAVFPQHILVCPVEYLRLDADEADAKRQAAALFAKLREVRP